MNVASVVCHRQTVTHAMREAAYGHKPCVVWFTGLSGAGKSTLANDVERALVAQGVKTVILDGDNMRLGLCGDLGFSANDRTENIRRIAEVAKVTSQAGLVTLIAAITPSHAQRCLAREVVGEDAFVEIHVDCPLKVCEERDPKGLYRKARAHIIPSFTGLSSPYEPPRNPALSVDTSKLSRTEAASIVTRDITQRILPSMGTDQAKEATL